MNFNNFNLSDAKKNALLKLAGQKLGADPQALGRQIESGNLDEVVKNLDPNTVTQLNNLLGNPTALSALLGSDAAKQLINGLGGGR